MSWRFFLFFSKGITRTLLLTIYVVLLLLKYAFGLSSLGNNSLWNKEIVNLFVLNCKNFNYFN